jgi:hypothetical protein
MKITDQEMIHVQHAKWRISFLYSDLERLGPKARDEMKYKLYESVRDSNLQGDDLDPLMLHNPPGPPGDFVARINDDALLTIKRESKRVLEGFIKSGAWTESRFRNPTLWCTSFDGPNPYQIGVKLEGDVVAQAVLALMLHITYSRQARERLNRCENCGTIFLRTDRKPQKGRGIYCSPSCAQAAAMKRFRQSKADATAESQVKAPTREERRIIEKVLREKVANQRQRGAAKPKPPTVTRTSEKGKPKK